MTVIHGGLFNVWGLYQRVEARSGRALNPFTINEFSLCSFDMVHEVANIEKRIIATYTTAIYTS